MGKIGFLSKNYISKFLGDAADAGVSILDKAKIFGETGVPCGKLISYFAKQAITIKDKDKALNQAIGVCYYDVVCQALKRYKLEPEVNEDRIAVLGKEFTKSFEAKDFLLDSFWDSPIIKHYEEFYEDEFKEVLPAQDHAKLKRYVRDNLKGYVLEHIEEQKTVYEQLLDFLKSLAYQAYQTRATHLAYQNALRELYHEVVLDDETGLSLQEIYIEPNFNLPSTHAPKSLEPEYGDKNFTKFLSLPAGYDLHRFVYDFLQGKDALELCQHNQHFRGNVPQVLLLLGYPGQGKTSFCKRFLYDSLPAADAAEKQALVLDKNVYLIRLRHVEAVEDLLKGNLSEVLHKEASEQAKNIVGGKHRLDISIDDFENSVWLLDGLDELYMSNDLNKKDIDELLQRLINKAEKQPYLRIIITSRYGYVDLDKLKQDKIFIAALAEFTLEQQTTWLAKYTQEYITYNPYTQAPKRHTWLTQARLAQFAQGGHYLSELLRQPLLLHFIALLEHAVEADATQAQVYQQLFDELIQRRYDKTGTLEMFERITPEDLRELVRGLAFAMFQTGKNYIRKSDIKTIECVKEFQRKLGYREGENSLDTMLKNLMIAFYFQETRKQAGDTDSEDRGEYAIEFLHKSLMEYMTAEYMWETIKEKFLDKNSKEKYILSENNESEALKVMSDLFAKEDIDNYDSQILRYFTQIIETEEAGKKKEVSERLCVFLPYFFERHFLYVYDVARHTEPIETCKRIFFGCWTTFAYSTEGEKVLSEKTKEYLVYFIKLRGYNLDLSKINLSGVHLFEANLNIFVNGEEVKYGEKFKHMYVKGMDLSGADLSGIDLSNTNLNGVSLTRTDLSNAYLNYTNLIGADLTNSDLSGVDLTNSDLSGANLNRLDLSSVDLIGANLNDANLSGANLSDTDLSGANLSGVKFSEETVLEMADLRGAIMDADFKEFARRQGAIVDDDNTEEAGKEGEG